MLWFDVETRYKTTSSSNNTTICELWFDVETRYKTTHGWRSAERKGCGLM